MVEQERSDAGDKLRHHRHGRGGGDGALLHEFRQGPRAQECRHVGEGEDGRQLQSMTERDRM